MSEERDDSMDQHLLIALGQLEMAVSVATQIAEAAMDTDGTNEGPYTDLLKSLYTMQYQIVKIRPNANTIVSTNPAFTNFYSEHVH